MPRDIRDVPIFDRQGDRSWQGRRYDQVMSRMTEGEEGEDVLVFHFYMPDYDYQGKPIVASLWQVNQLGYKEVLRRAKNQFLKNHLKPLRKIHPSHSRMMQDGRIQVRPRLGKRLAGVARGIGELRRYARETKEKARRMSMRRRRWRR
jgi:hypothetical protein